MLHQTQAIGSKAEVGNTHTCNMVTSKEYLFHFYEGKQPKSKISYQVYTMLTPDESLPTWMVPAVRQSTLLQT